MRHIDLIPPVVEGQVATFRWRVDPETPLYRKTEFTLTFPAGIKLSGVPARLWWDILFICLHPHWLVLRPCQIRVPLKLAAGERRFWLQLLQSGADTLAAIGPEERRSQPLDISIVSGDLDLPRTPIRGSGFGSAFSGGKDSLLQASLLCELTERPLMVATTSPLPPLEDHGTARRRHVFDSIQKRRDVRFVEVESDFRSIWDNGFAWSQGFPISINELTDTHLYTSSLLAAGAAVGVTRLFVASEAEVQDNHLIDGRIVQHNHFMYSAATQRALSRWLSPYGVRLGSLTWPLYSMQVQQLLWTRYPDLCDLQYTCWRVQLGQETCSECEQCLRIAMTALRDGENPERMGVNLRKVVAFASEWRPLVDGPCSASAGAGSRPDGPRAEATRRRVSHVMDSIRRVSLTHLAACVFRKAAPRLGLRETMTLLQEFRRVRRLSRRFPRPSPLGVREGFYEWLDQDLRDKLVAIYAAHFPREPRERHFGICERSQALTLRSASSLD